MEFVVALAFVVLVAVFFFSLWMLVVTCQRRNNYRKMIKTRPSRFSILKNGNVEDVAQLGPNMRKFYFFFLFFVINWSLSKISTVSYKHVFLVSFRPITRK